jgi:hypothetical protein
MYELRQALSLMSDDTDPSCKLCDAGQISGDIDKPEGRLLHVRAEL